MPLNSRTTDLTPFIVCRDGVLTGISARGTLLTLVIESGDSIGIEFESLLLKLKSIVLLSLHILMFDYEFSVVTDYNYNVQF